MHTIIIIIIIIINIEVDWLVERDQQGNNYDKELSSQPRLMDNHRVPCVDNLARDALWIDRVELLLFIL